MSESSPYWIAENPYDPNNGDVHYYNYKDDCRDWSKYPKTRFASEFGFQEKSSIFKIKVSSGEKNQFPRIHLDFKVLLLGFRLLSSVAIN